MTLTDETARQTLEIIDKVQDNSINDFIKSQHGVTDELIRVCDELMEKATNYTP